MNSQQQCNHLGIISTDQINNWIGKIKCLHPIVIIIKNYLTKMNLNITYEGTLKLYFRWSQYLFHDLHDCCLHQTS
jgi:hypothetical protein